MNAELLYDEMKDALSYFGLKWADRDKMDVTFHKNVVVFSYENRAVQVVADD